MKKVYLTLLSIIITTSIYAKQNEVFAKISSPVFLNSTLTKTIGTVQTATPLNIIKEKNSSLLVKVMGWSAEGSETIIFKKVGERVIYAILDENSVKDIKIIKTVLDDYETPWNQVTINLWIKKENAVKDINIIWDEASALFNGRCGGCHPVPDLHHFTANQWPGIINSMKNRAGLMPNEFQSVVKYVQNHSK